MPKRFIYDAMSPEEFDSQLSRLRMKRDAFARLVGLDRTVIGQWHNGRSDIPYWATVILALLNKHPANIEEARQLAAENIRLDTWNEDDGEYPFLEKEAS